MAYVVPAHAIDEIERLADEAAPPVVEWINIVTGRPLRRQSIDMIRRTRSRIDLVSESVRYLHMCAGLKLNFATETQQQQFASRLRVRPVEWLQAA